MTEAKRSPWLVAGGILSVLLFFVPLWAPLIQAATFVAALVAARRGTSPRATWVFGLACSCAGFVFSLVLEYLFVV